MDQQAIEDRTEIGELLAGYARGVDSKHWDLWRLVLAPDACADYSSAGSADDSPRSRSMARAELSHLPMTQHLTTNVELDIDEDRAKARALVFTPMQLPGMHELTFCGARSHHDLVRTPKGWKSERLVEENLWFMTPPPR